MSDYLFLLESEFERLHVIEKEVRQNRQLLDERVGDDVARREQITDLHVQLQAEIELKNNAITQQTELESKNAILEKQIELLKLEINDFKHSLKTKTDINEESNRRCEQLKLQIQDLEEKNLQLGSLVSAQVEQQAEFYKQTTLQSLNQQNHNTFSFEEPSFNSPFSPNANIQMQFRPTRAFSSLITSSFPTRQSPMPNNSNNNSNKKTIQFPKNQTNLLHNSISSVPHSLNNENHPPNHNNSTLNFSIKTPLQRLDISKFTSQIGGLDQLPTAKSVNQQELRRGQLSSEQENQGGEEAEVVSFSGMKYRNHLKNNDNNNKNRSNEIGDIRETESEDYQYQQNPHEQGNLNQIGIKSTGVNQLEEVKKRLAFMRKKNDLETQISNLNTKLARIGL